MSGSARSAPVRAIVTVPPYATFLAELAALPIVAGFRLNTVMPIAEPHADVLRRLTSYGKPVWVDLKARQLRVVEAAMPPFTAVRVSHRVTVPLPCDAFFSDGREHARVLAIDGDKLILEESPRRLVGPGESVNLVHDDLAIDGVLTDGDRAWLAAMRELGERRVMLSFVESEGDVAAVKDLLPDAEVVCKIESKRGMRFAAQHGATQGRLMCARGDLYVELVHPHLLPAAMRQVVRADPEAILASRVLSSFARDPVPLASDLTDAAFAMALGYRTFLLGDEVCQRREPVLEALSALAALARSEGCA